MIFVVLGLIAALAALPITFALRVERLERIQASLTVKALVLRHTFALRGSQASKGKKADASRLSGGEGALFWFKVFGRADHARRFLLKHIRLEEATLRLRLGLADAARTASVTGLIRCLSVAVPPALRRRVTVLAQPDFLSDQVAVSARCIVRVRLGTLLITGFMAALAFAMQRSAQPPLSKEA